jgi:hypothetical protein
MPGEMKTLPCGVPSMVWAMAVVRRPAVTIAEVVKILRAPHGFSDSVFVVASNYFPDYYQRGRA